jgi:hypothetical protein
VVDLTEQPLIARAMTATPILDPSIALDTDTAPPAFPVRVDHRSATNRRITRARRGPASVPAASTSSWLSGSPV